MIGEPPNRLGLTEQLSLADERQASAQKGAKDRACALVSPTVKEAGRWIVGVVSITRSPPIDAAAAIEILRQQPTSASGVIRTSWIACGEANLFAWPGQDPRPAAAAEAHRHRPREIARTRPDAPSEAGPMYGLMSCGAIGQGRGGEGRSCRVLG
jgi:hypothetical protein